MGRQTEWQRALRQGMPDAERRLWRFLRNRHLCGAKCRRQHPIGHYIVDFACIERLLIIELDGSQHRDDLVRAYDEKRTAYLQQRGWRVIRFWNNQVMGEFDAVMAVIYQCLVIPE